MLKTALMNAKGMLFGKPSILLPFAVSLSPILNKVLLLAPGTREAGREGVSSDGTLKCKMFSFVAYVYII